jgi:hypothetical protein
VKLAALVPLALGALATLAAIPARAALGENASTVEADRQQMHANVQRAAHAAFTVHELQVADGRLVREYVAANGAVFAVTWHGPFLPDLRQLLGVHFDTIARSQHRQRGGLAHERVREGRLVFESNGHPRSFHGRAYLSDAVPAGVTLNDIE